MALSLHCQKLSSLCVHLQAASLGESPGIPGTDPNVGTAASWTDYALARLVVGETPVPEGSTMVIALTLLRIFPRLDCILFTDEEWGEVLNVVNRSREIMDRSSKQSPFTTP